MKQKEILKQDWRVMKFVHVPSENEGKTGIDKNHSGIDCLKVMVVAMVLILGVNGFAKAQFQWGINVGASFYFICIGKSWR
jgi:hypothetical protein